MAASWQKNLTFFFPSILFPSPDDAAFTAAAGWGEDLSPGAPWCDPYTPTGAGHLSGHTNPSEHPVLLPGRRGLTDATRTLLVSSSGVAPHPLRLMAKGPGIYNIKHHISVGGI